MKKFIFGCVLMLCGIIGSSAWLIAGALLVKPGAWSTMFNLFPIVGFGGADGIMVILYFAIAVAGAIIATRSLWNNRKGDK